MSTWSSLEQQHDDDRIPQKLQCLACGKPLQAPLSSAGSLRCLDCRDANAPLDAALVREWHASGARF